MGLTVPVNEIVPFVLEADRTVPEEFMAVYGIKPRTNAMANTISARYLQAQTTRGATQKTKPEKVTNADIGAFTDTVVWVKNQLVDKDSEAKHVGILSAIEGAEEIEYEGRDCWRIPEINTRPGLTALAHILSPGDLTQIFDAGNDINTLREGERREL